MFGDEKVRTKKARKRHGLAFWVIGIFTFAIESMLGINAAFLIDQSVSIVARNMLDGTPLVSLAAIITLIVSLAVGFCFIFGGMWTFSGFMNSLEDARAYRDYYGTGGWPVRMVWCLESAVVALDFTTLCFRATYFAERGALWLFVFFVILIILPPILGPLIHVLENTPHDRRLAKAYRYAEQISADDIDQAVQMMSAGHRTRLLSGDTGAIDDHYSSVEAERARNAELEQQRIAERKQKQQRANHPF